MQRYTADGNRQSRRKGRFFPGRGACGGTALGGSSPNSRVPAQALARSLGAITWYENMPSLTKLRQEPVLARVGADISFQPAIATCATPCWARPSRWLSLCLFWRYAPEYGYRYGLDLKQPTGNKTNQALIGVDWREGVFHIMPENPRQSAV